MNSFSQRGQGSIPERALPAGEIGFRHLMFRATLFPLLLIAGIVGLSLWQLQEQQRVMLRVERSDHTLSDAHLIYKLLVDMETGLRGYLLTGTPEFLEPYQNAQLQLPKHWQTLAGELSSPPLESLLARIQQRHREWLLYANLELTNRQQGKDYIALVRAGGGRRRMNEIRLLFDQLIGSIEQERNRRVEGARRSNLWALVLFLTMGTALAATLALWSRRQLQNLASLFGQVLHEAQTSSESLQELNRHLETRVEQRTAELSHTAEELAASNRELEAFSYSVSHDLRAPLRHIAGFANLIDQDAAVVWTPEAREHFQIIRQAATRAGTMVDDLLTFSRFGRMQLRRIPVDMNQLVGSLLHELAHELAMEQKNRQIHWQLQELPECLGDPTLLRTVWQNLLSNAIKYTAQTPAAEIRVCGEFRGQEICYWVADNGVGFDPKYGAKLFGVFQRLHHASEFEGNGIGLANVRRIIQRHGGQTWAEGIPGHGATFYFTLPLVLETKEPLHGAVSTDSPG